MAQASTVLRSYDEEVLREWVENDRRRKDLEKEARQLKEQNDLVAKDLLAALQAAGKAEITRGAFRAQIIDGRAYPSWKEEFIRRNGADEAAKIAAAQVAPKKVEIVEIGGS